MQLQVKPSTGEIFFHNAAGQEGDRLHNVCFLCYIDVDVETPNYRSAGPSELSWLCNFCDSRLIFIGGFEVSECKDSLSNFESFFPNSVSYNTNNKYS